MLDSPRFCCGIRRIRSAIAIAGISLFLGHAASAAERSVELEYERALGAEACPDEERLRAMVGAALGWDPFREGAARSIETRIARNDAGLEARIVVRAQGEITGERTISDPDLECGELARAVVLALSVAIDPLSFQQKSAPPVTATIAATPAPIERPSPPPEPVATERSLEIAAELSVLAALGTVPNTITLGIGIGTELGWPSFTLGFEARVDVPRSVRTEGRDRVSVLLAAAFVVPCFRYAWFSACGAGGGGAVYATGVRDTTSAWAGLGARLGAAIPIYDPVELRLYGEILATLARTTLYVLDGDREKEIWTSAPISGAFGAKIAVRFR